MLPMNELLDIVKAELETPLLAKVFDMICLKDMNRIGFLVTIGC